MVQVQQEEPKQSLEASPRGFCFGFFLPSVFHQRHSRATDCADRREALTANFSVSLAKCGVFNTARKICQIAQRAILLIPGCRWKCLFFILFIPIPNTPPTPPTAIARSPPRRPPRGNSEKSAEFSFCVVYLRDFYLLFLVSTKKTNHKFTNSNSFSHQT